MVEFSGRHAPSKCGGSTLRHARNTVAKWRWSMCSDRRCDTTKCICRSVGPPPADRRKSPALGIGEDKSPRRRTQAARAAASARQAKTTTSAAGAIRKMTVVEVICRFWPRRAGQCSGGDAWGGKFLSARCREQASNCGDPKAPRTGSPCAARGHDTPACGEARPLARIFVYKNRRRRPWNDPQVFGRY